MTVVRLENLTKRFGRVVAVDHCNLTIRDGEFMVLLGPSGCGKTTTLRLIVGLETPDEGRVYFDDEDVTYLPPKDRNVSMVFQSYAVWPHMKVYDNIAFPLKIKKRSQDEIKRRVKWASKLLRIENLLDRYPDQLSGGQRQRVAVARAIVIEPRVLLLDEPLSNLDALLRVLMRAELKKLQRELGVTTIYVTHDQVEAMTLADRVAVMNEGKFMQVGRPREVYEKPENLFVAGFIGSPRMNFFDAVFSRGVLNAESFKLSLLPWQTSLLEGYEGRTVKVGIRPECIYPPNLAPRAAKLECIDGTIDFIEPLGSDTILHVRVGDITLVVKVPGAYEAKIGSSLRIYLDVEKLHVFDPASEKAVF